MSTLGKTLTCMSAASMILTSATGCSDGINPVGVTVTEEEREAYEKARFLTPEGKAAAEQELARIHGQAIPADTATPDVNDALMHPEDWPGLAGSKLCEYTAALISTAHRSGTAVPEKATLSVERILERC